MIGSSRNICELNDGNILQLARIFRTEKKKQVSVAAIVSKKAFKPIEGNGLLLRAGENFITFVESEQVITVQQFYVVTVNSTSNHVIAKVKYHDYVLSQEGKIVQHYWSGFPVVSLTPGKQLDFLHLSAIKRKVMLLQTDENSSHGFVIDYYRPVQTSPILVVPCYPEIGDMLYIQGEVLNDVWLGHVKAINNADQTVSVQFFVPNSRWKEHNLYIKETRNRHVAREIVHWKSILGIANGHWISNSTWKKLA